MSVCGAGVDTAGVHGSRCAVGIVHPADRVVRHHEDLTGIYRTLSVVYPLPSLFSGLGFFDQRHDGLLGCATTFNDSCLDQNSTAVRTACVAPLAPIGWVSIVPLLL